MGEYQRAIAFHQQSLEIKREIGNLSGQAISLYNLANIHLEKTKAFDAALSACEESLTIMQKIQLPYVDQCKELLQKIHDAMSQ